MQIYSISTSVLQHSLQATYTLQCVTFRQAEIEATFKAAACEAVDGMTSVFINHSNPCSRLRSRVILAKLKLSVQTAARFPELRARQPSTCSPHPS